MSAPTPEYPALRPHLSSYQADEFVRPVQRFVWEPVPVEPLPSDGAGLLGRTLVLLGAHRGLRDAVAQRLEAFGCTVLAAVGDQPDLIDGIIDLGVLGLPYAPDPDGGARLDGEPAWKVALAETTLAIQGVYESYARDPRADARAYVVVTGLGGAMGYDRQNVAQPLGGVWAGLAKGLPRELGNLAVKIIDAEIAALTGGETSLSSAADLVVQALAAEYGRWDVFEIGHQRGRRLALAAIEAAEPEPIAPLDSQDCVLISGGARGVGFALVEHLARERGCRVVVTGRKPLPSGEQRDLLLDDDAFGAWQRERRAAVRTPAEVRALRAEVAKAENDRAVLRNLQRAAAEGLRVDYEACDVNDAAAVQALIRRLDPAPTVVIHNAGIDEPARFDTKSVDIVVRTVEVKVSGFAALAAALAATADERPPLKVFCSVGSLAGRMGGMIGQVDYAAGNEGLARLGFWGIEHGLPVQTLCWPTWERLGVIANYDAAVRYVSTISPHEGSQRWLRELEGGQRGEVVFLGQIGTALVPSQLRGFRLFAGHHDLPRLHALYHHLGAPETFVPFARFVSRHDLRPGDHPYLQTAVWQGRSAVPPGLLLELMVAASDWVVPPGWPLQDLSAIEDLRLDLDHSTYPAAGEREAALPLRRIATGSGDEQCWRVEVELRRRDTDAVVASARLVLTASADPIAKPRQAPSSAVVEAPPHQDGAPLRYTSATAVLPAPNWVRSGATATMRVPEVPASQLWTTTFPPAATIAPAAAQALFTLPGGGPDDEQESVRGWGLIELRPGAQQVSRLVASGDEVSGYTDARTGTDTSPPTDAHANGVLVLRATARGQEAS